MTWLIAICIIFILMFVNSVFHPFDEDSRTGYKLLFLQGIDGLENLPAKIRIDNGDVLLDIDKKTYSVKLKNVELLQEITETDKSVIKRALVGGILLGPVGAIVGGMSGIGTKKNKAYYLKISTSKYELYFKPLPDYEFDFSSCYTELRKLIQT